MSDQVGNHIVGFPMRRLICLSEIHSCMYMDRNKSYIFVHMNKKINIINGLISFHTHIRSLELHGAVIMSLAL